MDAYKLTDKWVAKTLTEEDIGKYLYENIHAFQYHDAETITHVSECCFQIYQWSTNQIPYMGDFLNAIVKDNLTEAAHRADAMNRTALWLYVAVLYNIAPAGWKNPNKIEN